MSEGTSYGIVPFMNRQQLAVVSALVGAGGNLGFEAVFLFAFGCVDNEKPWYVALMVLICFSIFVQMSEGTSYGIVPFMNRQQLAVVSALVGAGGNLGFEAVFLFAFGCVDNEKPWYVALMVLICFSIFVQMSEGTSYGIVPFMNRQQLAVVSALVGAGGNLGAVIAGFCFYKPIDDDLLPFKIHAGYVLFWTLLSPLFYWPEYGGMFSGPAEGFGTSTKIERAENDGSGNGAAKSVEAPAITSGAEQTAI
jgi:nitrate/nitrite transporter NarK